MSNRIDSSEMQPLKFDESSDSTIFNDLDVRGYRAAGTYSLPSEFAATPSLVDGLTKSTAPEQTRQAAMNESVVQTAADVISQTLNDKGPYNIATTSAIEKCIQTIASEAPKGREKEFMASLSNEISARTNFNAKIAPSQFSGNRVMVSLGFRDRDQVIRFSVSKHA